MSVASIVSVRVGPFESQANMCAGVCVCLLVALSVDVCLFGFGVNSWGYLIFCLVAAGGDAFDLKFTGVCGLCSRGAQMRL